MNDSDCANSQPGVYAHCVYQCYFYLIFLILIEKIEKKLHLKHQISPANEIGKESMKARSQFDRGAGEVTIADSWMGRAALDCSYAFA